MSATYTDPPAATTDRGFEEIESPMAHLNAEQLDELGRELDAIHTEVFADLGERDSRYIRSTIRLHRHLVLAARALLLGSRRRPLWFAGTAALSLAKILENMEIGHNVMHGQWDWMNDPDINSQAWDWDTASPADSWRHSHNYEHHTFTNIRGLDRDLGYEIMRIDPHQPWRPVYLGQPLYNLLLMGFFEWGVAVHDLNRGAIHSGEKSKEQVVQELKAIGVKARDQIVKDYVAFPALSALAGLISSRGSAKAARRSFKSTLSANFTANIVRNVWSYSIIFCGHFPDQTYTFSEDEVADETRGGFYVRQLLGAANIDGGRDRATRARHLPPIRTALQHRPAAQAARHCAPHDPASRFPRRQGAAEAWALHACLNRRPRLVALAVQRRDERARAAVIAVLA